MNYKTIAKSACSLVLLVVLLHEIHFGEILPYFKKISIPYLLVVILFSLLSSVLAIGRWILVMRSLKAPKSHFFYAKSYFKGITFNQVLPSNIGGDGYRMIDITKLGIPRRLAVTSVLADRLLGFAGLLIPTLFFLPKAYELLPFPIFISGSLLTLAGSLAILSLYYFNRIKIKWLQKHGRWIYDLSHTLTASFDSTSDLLYKLTLSITTNLLNSISFYFIALSLGIGVSLTDFIIIIPLVTIIMMVPISIAGWGVREGALVLLGSAIGISAPAALAISLLSGFISMLTSVPGLYFYMVETIRDHKKRASSGA